MKSELVFTDLTASQLNAIVKKLGGYEGALRFLRDETLIMKSERKWREQDGIIYFSVTSDGMTGEEWIKRLEKNGFNIGNYTKSILRSEGFKPSSGVTIKIVVLKGILWNDDDRITKNIHAKASDFGFSVSNVEVACLIRDNFSDEEIEAMGLQWIVIMHEPINDSDGRRRILLVNCRGSVSTSDYGPDDKWSCGSISGFAFALPRVSGS